MASKARLNTVLIDRFILPLAMAVVRKVSIRRLPMAMAEGSTATGGGGEEEESTAAANAPLLLLLEDEATTAARVDNSDDDRLLLLLLLRNFSNWPRRCNRGDGVHNNVDRQPSSSLVGLFILNPRAFANDDDDGITRPNARPGRRLHIRSNTPTMRQLLRLSAIISHLLFMSLAGRGDPKSNHKEAKMRLLTHNVMRNNAAAASKSTSPPRITAATKIRVDEPPTSSRNDEDEDENDDAVVEFAKRILPILDWDELVRAAGALGLHSLPPLVTPELAADDGFLRALYHVVMNVHLVDGMLTCSITGREFPVSDGIVNMMLEEEEV